MKAKMREKVEETILKCGAFIIFSILAKINGDTVYFSMQESEYYFLLHLILGQTKDGKD